MEDTIHRQISLGAAVQEQEAHAQDKSKPTFLLEETIFGETILADL